MKTIGLEEIILKHPFFAELDAAHAALISGCATNVRFDAGQYIFREGEPADRFFLIRHGRAALQLAAPGHGEIAIATLSEGEIAGVSWLVAPYRYSFDAQALDLVRAISLDAACLRGKCDADHDFGYAMMKRFVPVLVQRLQATRLQALDVYGA
jgi:CRP/FNR family transcriptional regulator, cyclic AMP receptor protein